MALAGCPEQSPPPPSSLGPAPAQAANAPSVTAASPGASPASPSTQAVAANQAAQATQAALAQVLDADTPCTLETKLVPGIPGSPGHLIASSINPNGNSELAQHMRTMQAELKLARAAIEHGDKVGPLWPRFRKIRCAWPTNQADRNPAFDASAQSYLQAVQALDAAPAADSAKAYDRVLDGCRSCHEQSCGGAIPAIEALRMAAPGKK